MKFPLKDEDLHHCPTVGYDLRNWHRFCTCELSLQAYISTALLIRHKSGKEWNVGEYRREQKEGFPSSFNWKVCCFMYILTS